MSGLLTSLQGVSSALSAFTQALNADQLNVSNASTPGYAAVRAVINPMGFSGSGSGSDSVVLQSTGNAQVDAIVQAASSQAANSQAQVAQLGAVNQQFSITGSTGILAAFQLFSTAFANLSVTPDDASAGAAALSAAQGVATAINSVAQNLASQSQSIQSSAQSTVSQINDLAGQIAQYNVQVRGETTLNPGADVSRRNALTQLSSLVGVTVTQNADGTVNVLAGGTLPLVLGDQAYSLSANLSAPAGSQITSSGGGVTPSSFSGTLGGLVDTLNNTITPILGANGGSNSQTGSLNTLAQGFASSVNSLLTSGVTSSGAAGVPLFTYDTTNLANVAATLAVDPSVTPDQLGLATTGASASSNGIANQLAGLAASNNPASQINGVAPQDYYSSIAQSVGQQLSDATAQSTSDQTSLTSAQANQTAVEGVSLDQEAINITADQRSWEAAAKLVTVIDNLTLDSVNLVGEQDT